MNAKLSPNEVLVKDTKVYSGSIGTDKTETDIMVTFTKEEKVFDFVDVFMTTAQTRKLISQLQSQLEYIDNKDKDE